MNETAIDWTDLTWNPVSGCEKVSQGCKFCYAETLAEKYRGTKGFPNGFGITLRPHKLTEPYKIKEPSLIFVNSMSDLFWEQIPESFRDKIVDIIDDTPQHEYQVLTKRPEKMLAYSKRRRLPDNFWAGVSVESPAVFERIDLLRQVDVQIRFLSIEPILASCKRIDLSRIHWVITGGESGEHLNNPKIAEKRAIAKRVNGKWSARDDRIEWIREIRDLCLNLNIAFFHKQWGGVTSKSGGYLLDGKAYRDYPRQPGKEKQLTLFI